MTFSDVSHRFWLPVFICWIKKFLSFCYWHNEMVIGLYVVQFWDNHARNFKWVLHYMLGLFEITCPTDLFRLSILFSPIQIMWRHTGEYFLSKLEILRLAHSFFNEHDKGSNLLGIVTWSVLGKQNRQAKEVCWSWIMRILFTFNYSNQENSLKVRSLNWQFSLKPHLHSTKFGLRVSSLFQNSSNLDVNCTSSRTASLRPVSI